MMLVFILVVLAAVVLWKISDMNDVAVKNGRPELSYSNPFNWWKALIGMTGFSVGYTPQAVKTGKEVIHTQYLESVKQLRESGVQNEVVFKQQKAIGKKVSHQQYDKVLANTLTRKAELLKEIETFQASL